MDKELLRLVIILIGMLVMIGMVLWHFFKTMRERREPDNYDDNDYEEFDFEEGEDEEYHALPLDDYDDHESPEFSEALAPEAAVGRAELPALIEFSIVARADEGFNGEDLFDAFERVGLLFGSVKVFERIDEDRLVEFAVASMAEPGTFPDANLDQFYCPGIVFYMQPRELDVPLAVFEDFVETIQVLAEELDGVAWDNQRQPLTAETVEWFRSALAR